MNAKQQLIAYIGIFLIGLTAWQHWRPELNALLFNATPVNPTRPGNKYPSSDQYGNLDPNGNYSVQPGTQPGTINIIPNIP